MEDTYYDQTIIPPNKGRHFNIMKTALNTQYGMARSDELPAIIQMLAIMKIENKDNSIHFQLLINIETPSFAA